MIRAGLTGGIATGKSAVAAILRQEGIPVLDADEVAREVVRPGSQALREIVEHFGPTVIEASGQLDRGALRAIVLRSPQQRLHLERMTHPRIRESIEAWLAEQDESKAAAAVVEAALLIETGSYQEYDLLMVVQCDQSTQLKRLVHRNNLGEEEAQRWIEAQLPLAEKAALADLVITNDGDLSDLRRQLQSVIRRLGGQSTQ